MRGFIVGMAALCTALAANAQQFTRVTEGDLVNNGGASRGACLIDYDNDGDLDAFITNSEGEDEFLYRNDGGGVFTRITEDPIVSAGGDTDGATWGDADNDGDLDCFFTNWANQFNRLFENNGDGTFSNIGVAPITTVRGYCETGSWGDYDNDGRIDLFVTHSAGNNHHNRLFHNDGNWQFGEITTGPLVNDHYNSRSADWCDFDSDGDLDMFTANESNQNDQLYLNGNGFTFSRVSGGDVVNDGRTTATSSWGDYDNDGDFDLFTGNFDNQLNRLYSNEVGGALVLVGGEPFDDDESATFGSAWGDYDNDGDLDLFLSNGYGALRQNYLYRNLWADQTEDGLFTRVQGEAIATDLGWSYGCTWGDVDRDGDLDMLVACWNQQNENNRLYLNNGSQNNWLTVKCQGTTSNYSGIGAQVQVKASLNALRPEVWQLRQISGQTGYCGQTLEAHFGLGESAVVDSLVVSWPSGIVDVFTNVPANQVITVMEEGGILSTPRGEKPLAAQFTLHEPYPNPFNPSSQLQFDLASAAYTTLTVYNVSGREVRTLTSGFRPAGSYSVSFDAADLPTGLYIARLTAGESAQSRKLMLVK